jgi:hypothetical protein
MKMSSQKNVVHQEDEAKPVLNGLAQHEESVQTPEEIKAAEALCPQSRSHDSPSPYRHVLLSVARMY